MQSEERAQGRRQLQEALIGLSRRAHDCQVDGVRADEIITATLPATAPCRVLPRVQTIMTRAHLGPGSALHHRKVSSSQDFAQPWASLIAQPEERVDPESRSVPCMEEVEVADTGEAQIAG